MIRVPDKLACKIENVTYHNADNADNGYIGLDPMGVRGSMPNEGRSLGNGG